MADINLSAPNTILPTQKRPAAQMASLPAPALSELTEMVKLLSTKAKKPKKNAKPVTLMHVLLDESGSMQNGFKQTMEGYNQQMATVRPSAEEIGCLVTQISFNGQNKVIASDVKADKIVPLSSETYFPGGSTALYDTVAAVVKNILSNPLAHDDNTSVLLTITTDGDDQGSVIWKTTEMAEFRQMMKAVNANDRWTVALSGPDVCLREFAEVMCVDADNVAAFKPGSISSRATAMASGVTAMGCYMSTRSMGGKKSESLYAGTASGDMAKAILAVQPPSVA